jgi:hypothetical protein
MNSVPRLLDPLPYQRALCDYLHRNERDLWNWFASAEAQADYTEHLRLELLKGTYRLDAETHADLYKLVEEVKDRLELTLPVTVYQAQQSNHLNACLYYIPGEGHIVLFGSVLSLLNAPELKALLGHELAHYHLWQHNGGELLIADRLLQTIGNHPDAAECHVQSARWFRLYTEIYADRGSFHVTEDLHSVISGLVKMQTGLSQVSGASYLKQAEEIFAKTTVKTAELSHPEAFIRARALSLWAERNDEAAERISAMIEGAASLHELDLVAQQKLTATTRKALEQFLRPRWFHTDAVLGHAKLFFDDFKPATEPDDSFVTELNFSDTKLREYVCYLLLDFATADPELDQMPLAAALEFAQRLEIDAAFEKLASKELKLRARDIKRLKAGAQEMLAKAEVAA